ncbi:hypothetical protein CDAR_399281 [Caerostris darwini]|uniref:Uncharacterized protein n=1 Tax=Caerostris darwini TaxID=1538125 RepID=A0AAV4SXL7_9ARAC|nr:hypothetical protein CDAR_399281 [Caerostris darwini]
MWQYLCYKSTKEKKATTQTSISHNLYHFSGTQRIFFWGIVFCPHTQTTIASRRVFRYKLTSPNKHLNALNERVRYGRSAKQQRGGTRDEMGFADKKISTDSLLCGLALSFLQSEVNQVWMRKGIYK